jgi:hypothetical protein
MDTKNESYVTQSHYYLATPFPVLVARTWFFSCEPQLLLSLPLLEFA